MKFPKIALDERRELGRFDTPAALAKILVDWGVRSASDRVLEPSCGGGVLVAAIREKLSAFGGGEPWAGIAACDIDERALVETSMTASLPLDHLILGDFLSLESRSFGESTFDVILGNPPYVRLHTMSASARTSARSCLPDPSLLGAKASLWAYFPIQAFKFLRVGGRMGWILPESLLHVEYGRQLLAWAEKSFESAQIVSIRERCFSSEGAKERVVLLLLEGCQRGPCNGTKLREFSSLSECVGQILNSKSDSSSLPSLNGHAVPHLIGKTATEALSSISSIEGLNPLSVIADVKIGVVTGDNGFFLISELDRAKHSLRSRHFVPVIARFSDLGQRLVLDSIDSPTNQRSLLLCPSPESKDRALEKYLGTYPDGASDLNRTMQKRSHWHIPILGEVPHAMLRYMGAVAPRAVLNRGQYYTTNNIHRLYFKDGVKKAWWKALTLALHSTYSQISAEIEGRQYGSGVLKLEPSEAKRVMLPTSPDVLVELEKSAGSIEKVALHSGWEVARQAIDEVIVKSLPLLARSLPVERATSVLAALRLRRTGNRPKTEATS